MLTAHLRTLHLLAPALLLSASCQSTNTTIAGFHVAWTTDPPSLTVHASDGRSLVSSEGPLLETRTTQATWQELFGAFLVSESDTPWNEPLSLTAATTSGGVTLTVKMSSGHTGTIHISSPTAGVLALTLTSDGQNRVRAGFDCADNDHFLGFGAQTDAIDHHGHYIPIWTSEPGVGKTDDDMPDPSGAWFVEGSRHQASYPFPAFLSSRGFAFLADDTHRQIFDVCQADPSRWTIETWDNAVTLKVYDGPTPATAIERLTADTGRQPMAGDIAFAPWNDAVFGSGYVEMIANELRAARIPSGAIWTEDYRGGSFSGENYGITDNWGTSDTLYPDIQQLAATLHAEGFRFFIYNNTFLTTGTDALVQAEAANVQIHDQDGGEYDFVGDDGANTTMVDLSTPAGNAFVESWLKQYIALGFDGWMADFAEWLPVDAALAGGQDAEAYHNTYPTAYHAINAKTFADAQMDPNTSAYFSRSGGLRDAPNQPVVWGGDQLASFDQNDGFPTALMRGLNLGLAGIAIYGSDIAGYQNQELPPSTKELYFRWTTLGALSTVMRTHHGRKALADWRFDTDAETTAHFARWSQFHVQLWPYLKSAAAQAFNEGMPIMRVLALAYPQDDTVWPITDEYMFGSSILVAPVLTMGATSRTVYLPADNWLPLWSGPPIQGPATATMELPTTEIGLFVRAGSIIPMLPTRLDTLMPVDPSTGLVTLDDVRTSRVLRVYAGSDGSWTDLDGTTYTLTSSTNDVVTSVTVAGAALASCAAGAMPCADIDSSDRLVTIQGTSLASVAFVTASGTSTVTSSGATTVEEIILRF